MADDWQAGDLALCVALDAAPTALTVGRIYTVADLNLDWLDSEGLGLFLVEVSAGDGWDGFKADRFRKIRPLTDEERDEFTTDLRTPVREPVA
jgi:hypothetical protein